MTTLTNNDVTKLAFIKKVDSEGNVSLVACPSDFKVGTVANASDLTVTGNSTVMGDSVVTGRGEFDSLEVGGGYGSSGVTISSAGVISVDGSINAGGDTIADSSLSPAITFDGSQNTTIVGDLTVAGNDIKDSGGNVVLSSDGEGYIDDRPFYRGVGTPDYDNLVTTAKDVNDFLSISGSHFFTQNTIGLTALQGAGNYPNFITNAGSALNTSNWTFDVGSGASVLQFDTTTYTYLAGSMTVRGLYIANDIGADPECTWTTSDTFGAGSWYVRYRGIKANTTWEAADEVHWQLQTDGGSWTTVHTVELSTPGSVSAGNYPEYDDATLLYGCSVDSFTFTATGTSHKLRAYRDSGNTTEWVMLWNFSLVSADDGSRYPCVDIYAPVGGYQHDTMYLHRFFNNGSTSPIGTITMNDSTVAYNTFTGAHGGIYQGSGSLSKSAIVKITGVSKQEQEPIYYIEETTEARDKSVIGVFGFPSTVGANSNCGIHSVGNGYILVCDEGGNIEIGDYICSSNMTGHGMKQAEGQLMNFTVAKATEAVDWSTVTKKILVETGELDEDGSPISEWQEVPSSTKRICCTYHCG